MHILPWFFSRKFVAEARRKMSVSSAGGDNVRSKLYMLNIVSNKVYAKYS